VGALRPSMQRLRADWTRGLDNAGKTTIVKKIMGEDVNSVSPTLGFIIKTIEYDGYVMRLTMTTMTRGTG
jgi:ADP-ribosylation factor-like protein 2